MKQNKVKVITHRGVLVVRWVDPLTGKWRQRNTGLAPKPRNWQKAYEVAGLIRSELDGDTAPDLTSKPSTDYHAPTSPGQTNAYGSWKAFKENYKKTHLSGLSAGYQKTMLPILKSFEDYAKPTQLSKIKTAMVRGWIQSLRDKGLTPNSVRTYWRHLSAFLSIAVDDGLIDSIPRVRLPKSVKSMKGRPLDASELKRSLSAIETIRPEDQWTAWKWDIKALWYSGLRIGEAYRMTWEPSGFYIDMTGKHPCYVILEQKNAEQQRLPIVPDFVEMLESITDRKGYVFNFQGQTKSGRVSFNQAKKVMRAIGDKAEISTGKNKTATAHDFRRSFGTRWALKPNITPQVLQKLMRHKSITTTMSFYAHLDADKIIDAINRKGD